MIFGTHFHVPLRMNSNHIGDQLNFHLVYEQIPEKHDLQPQLYFVFGSDTCHSAKLENLT